MHSPDDCDVRTVGTRADRSAFIDFPYALHRNERLWVPPLRGDQRRLLDRRSHPFYDFGEVELFLARRGGRVVGRIAAIDNPNHNRFHGTRDGFFGLFECVDDPGVAEALFTSASAWLRERRLATLLGPVSLSTNYECGMLAEGFDRLPAVQMPYNPPYYPRLMSGCGFTMPMELLAWGVPSDLHEDARLLRLAHRLVGDKGIRIRPMDTRDLTAEAARIREIYNSAWEANWGFSPMTDREFHAVAKEFSRLLRPGLGLIAESDGKPVGFGLAVPDFAPALAAAGGRLHTWGIPIGLVRLWRASRHLDGARLVALGVREEYRGRGVELLMSLELSRAAHRLGYRASEASWVLAANDRANSTLKLYGAQVTKRYHIYQRPL